MSNKTGPINLIGLMDLCNKRFYRLHSLHLCAVELIDWICEAQTVEGPALNIDSVPSLP